MHSPRPDEFDLLAQWFIVFCLVGALCASLVGAGAVWAACRELWRSLSRTRKPERKQ